MVPRPAINPACDPNAWNMMQGTRAQNAAGEVQLPDCVTGINFMMATWVIGCACDIKRLADIIKLAPWTFIAVVFSTAVAEHHEVHTFLSRLALGPDVIGQQGPHRHMDALLRLVLGDKQVNQVTDRTFVILHKAKVKCAKRQVFTVNLTASADQNTAVAAQGRGLQFGSIRLELNTIRQRLQTITIGIVDMIGTLQTHDVEWLVQWIVGGRIAALTGYFGANEAAVAEIAIGAGAVWSQSLCQGVIHSRASQPFQGVHAMAYPSYIMLFGYYNHIDVQDPFAIAPHGWDYGADILEDMVDFKHIPSWPMNDHGSGMVPHLGKVTTKKVAWERWMEHVLQLCVWIGTSAPSIYSQNRQHAQQGNYRSRGSHRGKGKSTVAAQSGTAKGNNKGKGKGKSTGKDKGKGAAEGKGKDNDSNRGWW